MPTRLRSGPTGSVDLHIPPEAEAVLDLRHLGARRLVDPCSAVVTLAVDHHVVELHAVRTLVIGGRLRAPSPATASAPRRAENTGSPCNPRYRRSRRRHGRSALPSSVLSSTCAYAALSIVMPAKRASTTLHMQGARLRNITEDWIALLPRAMIGEASIALLVVRRLPEQLLPVADLRLQAADAVEEGGEVAMRCGRDVNSKPGSLICATRSSMLSGAFCTSFQSIAAARLSALATLIDPPAHWRPP